MKQMQFDSAVYFSRKFSELCGKLHVCWVRRIQADFEQENQLRNIQKNFRKLTPAVRSEKVLAITAPRRDHTAYHSGKKLRRHT